MDDLLAAVKTVRKGDEANQRPLLTAVSSAQHHPPATTQRATPNKPQDNRSHVAVSKEDKTDPAESPPALKTPEEVLSILRAQPSHEDLLAALKKLDSGFANEQLDFSIHAPSPLQSQIVNVLVRSILPSYWAALEQSHRLLLLRCLLNVSGLSAIVAQIRASSQLLPESQKDPVAADIHLLKTSLSILKLALSEPGVMYSIWKSLHDSTSNQIRIQMAWKEFVSLLASGKVIACSAQAEDRLRAVGDSFKVGWLASGPEYASWLGKDVAQSCIDAGNGAASEEAIQAATQVLAKGLSMGYPHPLIRGLMSTVLESSSPSSADFPAVLKAILTSMSDIVKRQFLENFLRWLSTLFADASDHGDALEDQRSDVAAVTALLVDVSAIHAVYQDRLLEFLSDQVSTSSVSILIRRAGIAALAVTANDELQSLLEKTMSTFSDSIFINNAPILQQEAIAQTVLLASSYLHRSSPVGLLLAVRSANHTRGVSNRLSSSNTKARWLGMLAGTALSKLVDKTGSALNFGTDDMQTAEAQRYLGLTAIDDIPSSLVEFASALRKRATSVRQRRVVKPPIIDTLPIIDGKQSFGPPRPPALLQTRVIGDRVTEVLDEDNNNEQPDDPDDNFEPYAKPDSDPEDSDEDATLVNRQKVKPPVYIRDLMRMLRDDQSHDRFQLGLKHSAGLIRRKTGFGSEVRDHAQEIAIILCNLQDPFDTDDFDELKLRALIAVLLNEPSTLGPWLSRQAFIGDYSLSQRCAILSTLGLGGRELAGMTEQDHLNPQPAEAKNPFPSKRLPHRLHNIYDPRNPSIASLDAASSSLEHHIVQPLALSAADESTAHLNAVKVRTFSSRLTNERNRTHRKPAANKLARVFGEAFFAPLLTAYQQDIAAYGQSSVYMSAPLLLVTFLKTLALLLHASGPATFNLTDITTTYWDLILALHGGAAVKDISVLEALLFALLTLLEVNGERKWALLETNAGQLTQSREWIEAVFERVGGAGLDVEGSRDEVRVRTLAAAVLVKLQELMAVYRDVLTGGRMV